MLSLYTFDSQPSPCSYLPDRHASLHYEIVGELTADEYAHLLMTGWRRFGRSLFRPDCPSCDRCQSLRVDVARFKMSDSQRRAWKANRDITIMIGTPSPTPEKLALYDRFHAAQVEAVGWAARDPESASDYRQTFCDNPFPVEEWCYYLGNKLVGVGLVDILPCGPSAIYFYHDPDDRKRSLGTFNVLKVIERAANDLVPHAYLGYFVESCRSLEYKARFRPYELLIRGEWVAGDVR